MLPALLRVFGLYIVQSAVECEVRDCDCFAAAHGFYGCGDGLVFGLLGAGGYGFTREGVGLLGEDVLGSVNTGAFRLVAPLGVHVQATGQGTSSDR